MTPNELPSPRPAGATGVPVIVGAGLAGLVTALRLAPHPVIVLAAGRLGQGAASGWAQGGIAAAVGPDDSSALHAADTVAAGAGLCEPEVVLQITAAGPAAVAYLGDLGARFDRTPDGGYRLGLEGAHSRNRIVHAAGDGTGAEILRAVVEAVRRSPSISVLEGALAKRILVDDGHVAGVLVEVAPWATGTGVDESEPAGLDGAPAPRSFRIRTGRVVLATGGSGQLWQHTTNPSGSRGQGLALAARAGAELRDLEMVQFHPTALDVGLDPMPLVSEAVRGAGAVLVDAAGAPLTDDPLAARDVVARAVWGELSRGGQVFLDARRALGSRFAEAFPTVARACLAAGVDPARDPIPVRPAAHYQCGGVTVGLHGRTTVPGLWAVGEVASTGLHGANRLASNSLLEAVVCGGWVAEDLAGGWVAEDLTRLGPGERDDLMSELVPGSPGSRETGPVPEELAAPSPPAPRRSRPGGADPELDKVRALMTRAVGILRTGPTLEAAEAAMLDAVGQAGVSGRAAVGPWGGSDLDLDLIDDATLVALLVTHCARQRRESRGGHTRLDHPTTAEVTSHTTVTLHDVLDGARDSWDGALTRLEQAARRVEDSSHPAPAPADLEPTDLVHSGGSR